MTGVYKITNMINGKCYVGQAVNIKRRWKKHKEVAFNNKDPGYSYPLYQAIRKYGLENFAFEVLEECKKEDLEEKEIFYIAKYNSYLNGYNQNTGGAHVARHCCFKTNDLEPVIEAIRKCEQDLKSIAKEFGVSVTTIRALNRGETYRQDDLQYPLRKQYTRAANKRKKSNTTNNVCSKCGAIIHSDSKLCVKCFAASRQKVDRPSPLDLAKMVKDKGFRAVGELFGVSDKTITKWCKSYNIPNTYQALVDWYNDQMGIVPPPPIIKIKNGNKERSKPVKQIDPKTGCVIKTFDSAFAAGIAMGKSNGNHISEVCRGLFHMAYGYIWEFV